jgi:hypothetical protein
MLQFVVDWLSRADPSEPIEVDLPVVVRDASAILQFRQRQEDIAGSPTPRERGIRFHQEEFARLFEAVERWPSVEFLTAGGLPSKPSTICRRAPTAGSTSSCASSRRPSAARAISPGVCVI